MMQKEIKLMLEKLIKDRKSFRKLYKSGYFSYFKDKSFKGKVSIVGDRAVIAYLEDLNDENRVIATANFQENGIQIFKLLGDDWSHHQFDWEEKDAYTYGGVYLSKLHNYDRDKVAREIATICGYCEKTPKKESIIKSIGKKRLSKKQVFDLLLDTLDKLNQTRKLQDKKTVCPKVDVQSINSTNILSPSASTIEKFSKDLR